MAFDGNPLNYYLFLKTFENSVEKCTEDDSLRLQLLIQYCTGKAKETIKCCGMMSGKDGYVKAKKLLEERFGEKYVVSNAWIEKLSEGPPIDQNDREALLDLADDLESCEIPLRLRVGSIRLTMRIRRLRFYIEFLPISAPTGRKGCKKSEQMVEIPTLKIFRKWSEAQLKRRMIQYLAQF